MKEWLKRSLTEMTAGLAAREVSAEELMRATLQRIEETQSSLNCFTCLADEESLLDQARQADSRIANGEGRELEGIPLGVKDLEDVEGMVTSYGSVPFKDNRATRDSLQTERLRAAGAFGGGQDEYSRVRLYGDFKELALWGLRAIPGTWTGHPGAPAAGRRRALPGASLPWPRPAMGADRCAFPLR